MKKLKKIINQDKKPVFKDDLTDLFNNLNIQKGDIIILHVSLSSFGYLVGGEVTLIDTLLSHLGDEGTLVMPAQTVALLDPQYWEYPAVPIEWHDKIRESIQPYNRKNTPVGEELGKVATYFCRRCGVSRSEHPLYSFCAYGNKADEILSTHPLDYGLGRTSPLGKLYKYNAKILMLGTNFESNTAIHLAEYDLGRQDILEGAPILVDGMKQWVTFKNIELDKYDDYLDLQKGFFASNIDTVYKEKMYKGYAMSFSMVECVDYAKKFYLAKEKYLNEHIFEK